MFWDNFMHLCQNRGIFPAQATKEMGLSNSVASTWKKGHLPQMRTLRLIADYFGVSVDYLLAENEPTAIGGGLSEIEWRLVKAFRSLPASAQDSALALLESLLPPESTPGAGG